MVVSGSLVVFCVVVVAMLVDSVVSFGVVNLLVVCSCVVDCIVVFLFGLVVSRFVV